VDLENSWTYLPSEDFKTGVQQTIGILLTTTYFIRFFDNDIENEKLQAIVG
jgi:hypothetical protein